MPATLANIFLFILRGSVLQVWGMVVDFRVNWSQLISVCNSERIMLKSDSIYQSYAQMK